MVPGNRPRSSVSPLPLHTVRHARTVNWNNHGRGAFVLLAQLPYWMIQRGRKTRVTNRHIICVCPPHRDRAHMNHAPNCWASSPLRFEPVIRTTTLLPLVTSFTPDVWIRRLECSMVRKLDESSLTPSPPIVKCPNKNISPGPPAPSPKRRWGPTCLHRLRRYVTRQPERVYGVAGAA